MGLAISRDTFTEDEFVRFSARLREDLDALRALLDRPGFGEGAPTVGAELEMFLVDDAFCPLPANREVLARTFDPRLTVEMDRFNLEANTLPVPLAGRPFTALGAEMTSALDAVARAAAEQGGRVLTIGILPTLRPEHLTAAHLTDLPRYRALSASLRRLRGAPFQIHIHGDDPLALATEDAALEGACTSLQLHLRVPPESFASMYNAAQIATIAALAASGNAPVLCRHRLWEETRIALFKQSTDDRCDMDTGWHPASRVSFGYGWVRRGAFELFAESVALFAPLLPVLSAEEPAAVLAAGGVPSLAELRLHQGTVWRWNRAVYDPAEGGHLRIEMRALPAGPTVIDMLASAAFQLGLTLGLFPEVDRILPAYPFELAHHAFYRAAQYGLSAMLPWPTEDAPSPRPVRAAVLCERLLPVARQGLVAHGVAAEEADSLLGIIAARVATGRTGARWQRETLEALMARVPREEALIRMAARYAELSATGAPVHCWPVEI
jgi:hypothetical protein